ncbi:MAG: hypothetical protein ACRC33_30155 [Gemmataceae bacterium]
MRHILLLAAVLVLGGCKTPQATTALKEKPIADPLFTSKKPALAGGRGAAPPRGEDVPLPQPPPALAEPPRPDVSIRLAADR